MNLDRKIKLDYIITIWRPSKKESLEGYFYLFPTILIEKQNKDIIPGWIQVHFCWLFIDFWINIKF